jgi:hypothetical protein
MDPACAECVNLWKKYQRATIEAVRLENEAKACSSDFDAFQTAALQAHAAEVLRIAARNALMSHQTESGHA